MVNKEKDFNNMFKENENSGEHRNGRKSQFKNHNKKFGKAPNEYISKKED